MQRCQQLSELPKTTIFKMFPQLKRIKSFPACWVYILTVQLVVIKPMLHALQILLQTHLIVMYHFFPIDQEETLNFYNLQTPKCSGLNKINLNTFLDIIVLGLMNGLERVRLILPIFSGDLESFYLFGLISSQVQCSCTWLNPAHVTRIIFQSSGRGKKGGGKQLFFFFSGSTLKKRKCYWSTVGLQHCGRIRCTSKFLSYT